MCLLLCVQRWHSSQATRMSWLASIQWSHVETASNHEHENFCFLNLLLPFTALWPVLLLLFFFFLLQEVKDEAKWKEAPAWREEAVPGTRVHKNPCGGFWPQGAGGAAQRDRPQRMAGQQQWVPAARDKDSRPPGRAEDGIRERKPLLSLGSLVFIWYIYTFRASRAPDRIQTRRSVWLLPNDTARRYFKHRSLLPAFIAVF